MNSSKDLQRIARIGSNLSKEFTSPLSVLVSTLEDFERNETDRNKKLQLRVALRNAHKFRSLTRDIFALSRLLSAPNLHRMVQTNLVDFLSNVIDSFQPAASKKNVELQFKSNVDELITFIDFQKTYRVLYRLLANGIRFMKAEGGIVRLSLFYLKETNQARIEVWDNGIGIIEEKIPHMFNLFYEEDPIHLTYYQGTSIGLILTKHFIESLGGKIDVSSAKFEFTKFDITIPVFKSKSEIPFEHLEILENTSFDQLVLMEEVMSVDTDEILEVRLPEEDTTLVAIVTLAEHHDFWKEVFGETAELLFYDDTDSALGRVLELVPDVIIVQHKKDILNGIEAISFLRRNETVSHMPMILFDSDKRLGREEISNAEADELIADKSSPQKTKALIDNLIDNRKRVFKAAYQQAVDEFKKSKSLSMEDSFLAKINGLIDKHMSDEKFNVEVLSEEMYMSRTQIHRKLKAIVGLSTTQYIKKYKMQKAMQDLKDHTGTISEIAYRYGFSSPAYFSRVFQDIYGKKPSTVRND
jgi:AraC-like DNA-binding protein/two-component sensor histidine kinase